MEYLTKRQHQEALYNYFNNDIFDHVLLDDRAEDGTITTVVRYDEETILIQRIKPDIENELSYTKCSLDEFLPI